LESAEQSLQHATDAWQAEMQQAESDKVVQDKAVLDAEAVGAAKHEVTQKRKRVLAGVTTAFRVAKAAPAESPAR
jgi:hypothetical protein